MKRPYAYTLRLTFHDDSEPQERVYVGRTEHEARMKASRIPKCKSITTVGTWTIEQFRKCFGDGRLPKIWKGGAA